MLGVAPGNGKWVADSDDGAVANLPAAMETLDRVTYSPVIDGYVEVGRLGEFCAGQLPVNLLIGCVLARAGSEPLCVVMTSLRRPGGCEVSPRRVFNYHKSSFSDSLVGRNGCDFLPGRPSDSKNSAPPFHSQSGSW